MLKAGAVSKNGESGQVTLMHLLSGIAFCMPIVAATTELKHSGGEILRYLVAVPSALALGAMIVSLDWKLGKTAWLRCQRYSNRAQNAVAVALFALEPIWIVVGGVSGFKLASFVAEHVAR
jgi:hypothetical protein